MNKTIPAIVLIILVAGALIFVLQREGNINTRTPPVTEENLGENLVIYENSIENIKFTYPKEWGGVTIKPGNQVCPEEDTYRTGDTLSLFDREFAFADKKLEGSESFIRYGVRVYKLNTDDKNDCQDAALIKLQKGETTGPEFYGRAFTKIDLEDFSGWSNMEASRLNTEAREQYILLKKGETGPIFTLVQPYFSFIPHFGSPELKELDEDFGGDMKAYLEKGSTALSIRMMLEDFREMAESINIIK
jgi:hypothetical protein